MHFLRFVRDSFSHVLHGIMRGHAAFILVIPAITTAWFLISHPVTSSEAITLLPSPAPCIPLWIWRLPSMVAALLSWSILFYGIRKWLHPHIAMLTTGIASTLFMALYYGFVAGVCGWIICCFLVACLCVLAIRDNPSNTNFKHAYILSAVTGIMLMPAFVLPVIVLAIVLAFSKRFAVKQWVMTHGIIALVAGLFHIIRLSFQQASGTAVSRWMDLISASAYLEKVSSFWYQTLSDITGLLGALLFFFIIAAMVALVWRRQLSLLFVLAAFFVIPTLALWSQSLLARPEVFIYFTCIIALVMVIPHISWLVRIRAKWIIPGTLSLQLLLVAFFVERLYRVDRVYMEFADVTKIILSNNKKYYVHSELYGDILRFEAAQHGIAGIYVYEPEAGASQPVQVDTVTGYDFIVLDNSMDETKTKQPLYLGSRITVYSGVR